MVPWTLHREEKNNRHSDLDQTGRWTKASELEVKCGKYRSHGKKKSSHRRAQKRDRVFAVTCVVAAGTNVTPSRCTEQSLGPDGHAPACRAP